MTHPPQADLGALIAALSEAGVEFIVVGGAAAVLHGAPITTQDLDLVPNRSSQNVQRLLALLQRLDAALRDSRGLRPTAELLSGSGQLLLSTSLGPLDLLCVLHDQRGYDELLPATELVSDGSIRIRVLNLETLISVEAAAGRAKDKLTLPMLVALRDRKRRG